MKTKSNQRGFNGGLTGLLAVALLSASAILVASSATATATGTPSPTPTATATATATPLPPPSGCPLFIVALAQNFDGVTAPALPGGWVSTFTPGPANCTPAGTCALGSNWVTSTTDPETEPNCVFHDAPGCVTDSTLDTPSFGIPNGALLFFRHSFDLENGRDGAVLEISINGGSFVDFVAAGGENPGYNGTISSAFLSPIAGRPAWTGNSAGYRHVNYVHMPLAAGGQNIRLRFRLATDCSGSGTGWRIDAVTVGFIICPTPTPSPTPSATPTATAPDNTGIAFASTRDGNFEIYAMDSNGSNQTRLTNSPANDTLPAWSPDRTKIAFTSQRDGNQEIYVMDANGANQIRLTNNSATDASPAWSPDGTRIVFTSNRDGNYEIYVMNADGSNPIRLTNNSAIDNSPNWSPDGAKIAFASDRDGHLAIFVMDANGANPINLTNTANIDFDPSWSPDGTKIAFVRDDQISVMNADGSNPNRITFLAGVNRLPAWWPEGARIAFVSNHDGNDQIWVTNANGSNQARLTHTSAADSYPSWGSAPGAPTPTPTATATATGTPSPTSSPTATATAIPTPTPTPTPTPPTLIVTTTSDDGPGSLRQAIADAQNGDIIGFDPALNGQTISLTSGELVINQDITISGPGSDLLTVSRSGGPQGYRIIHIMPSHTVAIQGLTISGGSLQKFDPGFGAGVFNEQGTLTIDSCAVSSNNSFYSGGGIYNAGTLTVSHSTIIGNFGGFGGGGIHNVGTLTIMNSAVRNNTSGLFPGVGGSTGLGAGIYNAAMAAIVSSTIDHNTANGGNQGSVGGGIYSPGSGPLTVSNSTISQNVAFIQGGAIYGGGSITNCTISGNTASQSGASIYVTSALEVSNTILNAGANGANILNGGGTVASHGYNLSSDNGAGFLTAPGDQINTDPMLGPLQDNGGPTLTHHLLTSSPAINAGDPNFTPPPDFDQRGPGYPRVFSGRLDIGSFELQVVAPTPSPVPAQPLNLSTRLLVQTGNNIGIGGFIITPSGGAPKQVLVRAIGPSLAPFGVPNALADPTFELRGPNGALILANDNWRDTQEAAIMATGLAPTNDLESAILATVNPGNYTALVAGKNNTTGVGLVEVYDLGPATSQLANISTRAFVSTVDNVVIGGFILGGGDHAHIFIHAGGPFGINPALADAVLELRDGTGALLASNDDCESSLIGPPNPADACIDITLPSGLYTAILAGKDGGTGVGLLEIYNLN